MPAGRYGEFAILRGDPSDDLPGVRGIGEKTARTLVNAFGSIDDMLAAAARGDPAISLANRTKLLSSREYLEAMRKIVPINADAPLSLWAGDGTTRCSASSPTSWDLRTAQRVLAALDAAGALISRSSSWTCHVVASAAFTPSVRSARSHAPVPQMHAAAVTRCRSPARTSQPSCASARPPVPSTGPALLRPPTNSSNNASVDSTIPCTSRTRNSGCTPLPWRWHRP